MRSNSSYVVASWSRLVEQLYHEIRWLVWQTKCTKSSNQAAFSQIVRSPANPAIPSSHQGCRRPSWLQPELKDGGGHLLLIGRAVHWLSTTMRFDALRWLLFFFMTVLALSIVSLASSDAMQCNFFPSATKREGFINYNRLRPKSVPQGGPSMGKDITVNCIRQSAWSRNILPFVRELADNPCSWQ